MGDTNLESLKKDAREAKKVVDRLKPGHAVEMADECKDSYLPVEVLCATCCS